MRSANRVWNQGSADMPALRGSGWSWSGCFTEPGSPGQKAGYAGGHSPFPEVVMRRAVLLAALLFAPVPARAAEFDPKPVDEVVEKALKEFHAPGAAVVIVKDDEVVYLKGFG